MKVSEEFILEAHKAACSEWKTRIENEFPKLFANNVKVRKWYMYNNDYLVLFTNLSDTYNAKGYGFITGVWDEFNDFAAIGGTSKARPATEEEVKQALIAEAKKRGFKYGVTINKDLIRDYKSSLTIDKYDCNNIEWEIDCINSLNFGSKTIFKDGKWAEIIPQAKELTVAEIEEKLGYKIKIVK
jgi:hypothetical protein